MSTQSTLPYIIIPLGGIGSRFKTCGYSEPKPFVRAGGKFILYWLLDSLNPDEVYEIIIPYNDELDKYNIRERLYSAYPKFVFKFLKLPKEGTSGAADTILRALCLITESSDRPVICLDGDNFYTTNILKLIKGNNVICFKDEGVSESSPYSHIVDKHNYISEIVEKKRVSDFACTGCYAFQSWKTTLKYLMSYISLDNEGELYTSRFISWTIAKGEHFQKIVIDKKNFQCLGTPLDVMLFSITPKEKKRITFHLEEVLLYPITPDYLNVIPVVENIQSLRNAKDQGHTIIIQSIRPISLCDLTCKQLKYYMIPYNELYLEMPTSDVYVFNDLAEIDKHTGIYSKIMIPPRNFNEINTCSSGSLIKRSNNTQKLKAEIMYYLDIPSDIDYLFPSLKGYDTYDFKWYEMEHIKGIPLSTIYIDQQMSVDILELIITNLQIIHNKQPQTNHLKQLIYSNYLAKLCKCLSSYDYSIYDGHKLVYDRLFEVLEKYEKSDMGSLSMIHGDPVFTNIILNESKELKFIDMRGLLGDIVTIYGDVMYDWAKLYQSLIGYEEIRTDTHLPDAYKKKLITYFEERFTALYGREKFIYLRHITSSLFFTLIPYHPEEKGQSYLNLAFALLD